MAKPDDALNLALDQLSDAPWPPAVAGLERSGASATIDVTDLSADSLARAAESGMVRADRFTCRVDAARFASWQSRPKSKRTLLISAIDADSAAPLNLWWLLAHVNVVPQLVGRLATAFDAQICFALPADPPTPWRSQWKALGRVLWLAPRYPTGHYRLLPRVAQVPLDALVLDVAALIDLATVAAKSESATIRPIVISQSTPTDDATDFLTVARSRSIGHAVDSRISHPWMEHGMAADTRCYTGPRLADRIVVDPTMPIGDGELTFYLEPRGGRFASPCIRCAGCVQICPTRCDPIGLVQLSSTQTPSPRRARWLGLEACIDCGLCTAVCPSGIELHHGIASLRERLEAKS